MVAASPQARKRLQKEYQSIVKAPPPFIFARPNEQNILEWHFIMRGPPDTPYHDGEYYGVVLFPHDYPFAPPGLKMNTPSGRFVPGAAICTSMSNFHPGSWNPGWSVQTILTGLLSFMVSEEITTGSLKAPQSEREALAAKSHAWNIAHPKFKSIFPEYSNSTMTDLPDMGPPPPAPPASSSDPTTPAKSTEARAFSLPTRSGKELDEKPPPIPDAELRRLRIRWWLTFLSWTIAGVGVMWALGKVVDDG